MPIVMRQDWWHLLFLHWEVPAAALRPLVPDELEIDAFDGRSFVGLVPFTMSGIRPVGTPPIPGLSSFHEVNVRTYVRHPIGGPGVWFFSLDAAGAVAVAAARWLFHLPYWRAAMSLRRSDGPGGPVIDYRSERRDAGRAGCRLRYGPTGPPARAASGTLEHFLIERYVLYCRHRSALLRGRVYHEPYPIQPASVTGLHESLVAAAGIERPPTAPLAHYAAGVRVKIGSLEPAG